MRSPPASDRGLLLVTAQKLPQHRRDPRPTVRASDLWGFCARRVSDARMWRAGTRAERVRPLAWHQARACPPLVWANRYRSAKQQAHRTLANACHTPFANPPMPFTVYIRRAPSSRYSLEIATAPAGSTRPGAQPSARRPPTANGGSVLAGPWGTRQPPGRTHALGPGTGKSGGGTQHAPNPAMLPLTNLPAASRPPCLSQGPMIASPPRNCHSTSRFHQTGAQPSARRPPAARVGSVLAGPRGARQPPARTHALGPGMGKSGGRPSTLATPPRSRSRTLSRIASTLPQSGASAIASTRCPLAGGPTAPHDLCRPPGRPT